MIPSPGETFHGRDVFAPAAALLASGEAELADLGPLVAPDQVRPLLLPLPKVEGLAVSGEAWWVDHFGNVQTNIGPDELSAVGVAPGSMVTLTIGATIHVIPWVGNYSDVERGEPLIHVDSAGLIAVAVREGRADEMLRLGNGVVVTMAGRGLPPVG
jgi:hypothetical protein